MDIERAPSESDAHAAHRPPAPPPTAFGNLYPRGDIIAPAADHATAEAIAQDLRASGFPDGDVDVVDNEFAIKASAELERRRGVLGRLGSIFGDEHSFAQEFAALAGKGFAFVVIHAPDQDALERARRVLASHHVNGARHYGRFIVTDL